ncbi:MAG: hypothetical protein ACNA8L_10390 [Luteolibacter sp.]
MSHPDYHNHPGHADHDPALDDNFHARPERTLVLDDNFHARRESSMPRDTPADLESAFRRVAQV